MGISFDEANRNFHLKAGNSSYILGKINIIICNIFIG